VDARAVERDVPNASYCDLAEVLVRLTADNERTWERKALFFNYGAM
jgi:hypothetical protein